jgi:plasmid stabilization system protein ParE
VAAARLARTARRDFFEALEWINEDSPKAARAFQAVVIRAAERIGRHPQIAQRRPEWTDAPFRFLPLGRFPYTIVYDTTFSPPLIARILHSARDLPSVLGERESS